MSYYDESIYGIDMNLDGKTDWKDDILISTMIVEETVKRSNDADESDLD